MAEMASDRRAPCTLNASTRTALYKTTRSSKRVRDHDKDPGTAKDRQRGEQEENARATQGGRGQLEGGAVTGQRLPTR